MFRTMYLRFPALSSGPYGRGPTLSLISYEFSWLRVSAVRLSAGCIYFCARAESAPTTWRIRAKGKQGDRFQVPLTTHKQPYPWALSKFQDSTQTARTRSVRESAWIGSEESDKKTPLCDLFCHCFAFVGLSGGALKPTLVSDWMSAKWE